MRVKFGRRIYICTVATLCNNSSLILLTTSNGVYTIDTNSIFIANDCHAQLLEKGYCDFSDYEYSN